MPRRRSTARRSRSRTVSSCGRIASERSRHNLLPTASCHIVCNEQAIKTNQQQLHQRTIGRCKAILSNTSSYLPLLYKHNVANMPKRTLFTNITPLPPEITREVAIAMLHDHDEMIELNPLVIGEFSRLFQGRAGIPRGRVV